MSELNSPKKYSFFASLDRVFTYGTGEGYVLSDVSQFDEERVSKV